MNYLQMLKDGYSNYLQECRFCTRKTFLSELIFEFDTEDSEVDEWLVDKALEVATVISRQTNYDYIKASPKNYKWYILMLNMPFFNTFTEYGISIRSAQWEHAMILYTTGLYIKDKAVSKMEFNQKEWIQFIEAMCDFAYEEELEDL